MKWQGINEFVEVGEMESFTLAAKKLNISIAQVSRQVSALENRLQIKLLHRSTRKVSLTQAGKIFYQHCRDVLDGLDAAEFAVTKLQSSPQGKIKLSAPVTYGEQKILPLVHDFIIEHQQIEVNTVLSNTHVNLVEEGFDLAIRTGNLKSSSLIAKKLSVRATHVCASPQYLAQFGTPLTPADLKQHNCLSGVNSYWRFIENNKEKNIRISGGLRCNSGIGLVDAALKHIGIIQLPDYYVQQYLDSGILVNLLEQFKIPDEGVWAVYPDKLYLPAKTRLLMDYLSKNL